MLVDNIKEAIAKKKAEAAIAEAKRLDLLENKDKYAARDWLKVCNKEVIATELVFMADNVMKYPIFKYKEASNFNWARIVSAQIKEWFKDEGFSSIEYKEEDNGAVTSSGGVSSMVQFMTLNSAYMVFTL